MTLTVLDVAVVLAIFVTTLVIIRVNKSSGRAIAGENELLLMSRQISLPLFVASLVSSWYGGITGVTALTYEKGLFNFLTQGVFWYLAYIVFALILVKRMPREDAKTFPELIGKMLGSRARRLGAIFNVVNLLPIACTLNLALLIRVVTGWSITMSSFVGVVAVLSYALTGGFRAVVYADLVQFCAMIIAVVLVVIFSVMKWGSPANLVSLLPAQHLTLTGGQSYFEIFIWGSIAFSTLVDPMFYQRALAARSRRQAIKGVLIATGIWFLFDCCTTLGGLYAKAFFPNVSANDSYFILASDVLPNGLRGLFMAGMISAALSTLDSGLFTSASIVCHDLLRWQVPFVKRQMGIQNQNLLRIVMVLLAVLCLGLLPLFQNSVAMVWKVMGSISAACLLVPWLMVLLSTRVSGKIGVSPMTQNEISQRFSKSVIFAVTMLVLSAWAYARSYTSIDPFYFGLLGSMIGYSPIFSKVFSSTR